MGTEIGVLAVRRSVWIGATPERVWEQFESLERLRAWFGRGHRLLAYEPRLGGWAELDVEIDGERRRFGGRIAVFAPARELTFENDWIPNQGWAAPTFITLRLTQALEGTLVELFHHGFERVGPDAGDQHQSYEAGWGMGHLDALRAIVEQRPDRGG